MDNMSFEEFCIHAIRVPFKTRGRTWLAWDCWGLICVAYKEVYCIDLPTYTEQYRSIKQKDLIAATINTGKKDKWTLVKEAQEGDVIIVFMDGRDMHAGLAIDTHKFIHAQHGYGTCVERLSDYRIEGIYRRDGK